MRFTVNFADFERQFPGDQAQGATLQNNKTMRAALDKKIRADFAAICESVIRQSAAGKVMDSPLVDELVKNAIDAGATAITVCAFHYANRVIVRFMDNGSNDKKIGCRYHWQKAITTHSAKRASPAEEGVLGGAHLGLALPAFFLEKHEGSVWLIKEERAGAIITLCSSDAVCTEEPWIDGINYAHEMIKAMPDGEYKEKAIAIHGQPTECTSRDGSRSASPDGLFPGGFGAAFARANSAATERATGSVEQLPTGTASSATGAERAGSATTTPHPGFCFATPTGVVPYHATSPNDGAASPGFPGTARPNKISP